MQYERNEEEQVVGLHNLLRKKVAIGMSQERRKNKRFQPDDQTFVVLRPDYTKLGKLIDISEEGLSFQHMATTAKKDAPVYLDIFKGDNSLYLSKVPGNVVYDRQEETVFCYEHRRCGVRFGELSKEQSNWVSNYISQFTRVPEDKEGKMTNCR